jgi:hypothetical protein
MNKGWWEKQSRWEDDFEITDINPLKPKIIRVVFKNSVRTSKRPPHFTITKINWLTLFKEIIAVYTEKHTTP